MAATIEVQYEPVELDVLVHCEDHYGQEDCDLRDRNFNLILGVDQYAGSIF